MPKLFYQGHASSRITTDEGKNIFIDPYAGEGYKTPADLVLITHEHYDHNAIHLINMGPRTVVIRASDALVDGVYHEFDVCGVHIKAVPAHNSHHNKSECVGYVLTVNGVKIYHAGDTDFIPEMNDLVKENIDYALLPIDGFYTMSPLEASKAAIAMKVKHMIPIHMHPGMDFDMQQCMKVNAPMAMLVRVNDLIDLHHEGKE